MRLVGIVVADGPPRLPGDAENHGGDGEADQRVRPLETNRDDRGGSDDAEGDVSVHVCVVSIGDECGAVESPAGTEANTGREFVADEADESCERSAPR